MSFGFGIWQGLAALIALVWLVRAVAIRSALSRREILNSQSYDRPPYPSPDISVVVAAKDEEQHIESCIESLLMQDYPRFEVIAVDDRSSDRTPEILERLQRGSGGKLRVVTIEEIRHGWFGKSNAMREGVKISLGKWLCFTDADCRQISTRTLSMAMREAVEHDASFLSVTPVLETYTIWDHIIQPVCCLVLISWFLPGRVNDPSKRTAYANGAFMLVHRSCYDAIGGHERVRSEVNEDIHMARLAKGMGFRLRVAENDDLYITRMYRTLGEARCGWSRIFFGSLSTFPRLTAAAALVATLVIVPWVSFAAAVIGYGLARNDNASGWLAAAAVWGGVITLKQLVVWRLYDVLRVARPWSLTYIIGACATLVMLINAMLKSVGATTTTWRGTTYRGRQVVGPRAARG